MKRVSELDNRDRYAVLLPPRPQGSPALSGLLRLRKGQAILPAFAGGIRVAVLVKFSRGQRFGRPILEQRGAYASRVIRLILDQLRRTRPVAAASSAFIYAFRTEMGTSPRSYMRQENSDPNKE